MILVNNMEVNMKLVMTLIVALFFSVNSFAKTESKSLDRKPAQEMDPESIYKEAEASFKKADAALNATWKSIMKSSINEDTKLSLKNAQKLWLAFMAADCPVSASLRDPKMYSVNEITCREKMTIAREKDLAQYLDI